ncbi:uncharacterized protein LOC123502686 isoform X2 [Portunus trituberculatus]|uniref:uncharacterized protein LOC123502686 isoform X2 n=1 Tax=Portunus trituberculatus TaxID=210409 RepID=UPI001E1CD73E|nr:uncharacterized protein LOC123502686 isoform X2 [Portunus trituberculatus]
MPRGAPTMVPPVVVLVVLLSLLGANVPGCCESLTQDEDYDYADGCHPEEADTCFKDVNDNLLCNLGKPIPNKNCTGRNAYDLCESMSDALDCCEDIMDTCEESDGLDVFQVWFTGLDSVYSYLCMGDDDLALITDLLEGSNCFRLKKFITCVEDRANLTHVADLLTTRLDLHECNMIQVSVAACIEDAEKNKRTCRGRADAVKEALIVFFSSTACGLLPQLSLTPLPVSCIPPTTDTSAVGLDNATTTNNKTGSKVSNDTENSSTKVTRIPNQASTSRDTNTSTTNIPAVCQTTQDLGKRGTPTASTIVVTVLVTLVLVGLAGLVLVKRGVLTIRTDFDRRLAGLNDGDSSSGYDRF